MVTDFCSHSALILFDIIWKTEELDVQWSE